MRRCYKRNRIDNGQATVVRTFHTAPIQGRRDGFGDIVLLQTAGLGEDHSIPRLLDKWFLWLVFQCIGPGICFGGRKLARRPYSRKSK